MKNKKINRLLLAAGLAILMATGCRDGENRYTYRDAGIEALNAGNYESAITSFDQAIEASNVFVGTFDIDVLKYRAEAEYRAADYQAAADTYGVLIQVDQELPEYLNMRCVAKAQAGDLTGALEDYKRSAQLDTEKKALGRNQALLAAGAALEGQGASEEAMVLYEGALAEGMDSAELYNRMGLCKFSEKDYETATNYYTKGLAAQDAAAVPELLFNQAVVYEYQGEFVKARELMEQYVTAAGSDEEAERELEFLKTR